MSSDPEDVLRKLPNSGQVLASGRIMVSLSDASPPSSGIANSLSIFGRRAIAVELPASVEKYIHGMQSATPVETRRLFEPEFGRGQIAFNDRSHIIYLVPTRDGAVVLVASGAAPNMHYAATIDVALNNGVSVHFAHPSPDSTVIFGLAADWVNEVVLRSPLGEVEAAIGTNAFIMRVADRLLEPGSELELVVSPGGKRVPISLGLTPG